MRAVPAARCTHRTVWPLLAPIALVGAGPATCEPSAAASSPCELAIAADDPLAVAHRLTPGEYRCVAVLEPPEPSLLPVGAALVDRDGDGNRELVVAYRGTGGGALVWWPHLDGAMRNAEPPMPLDFAPAEMIGGDLDGDGRDELLLANAHRPELVALAVALDGAPAVAARAATPGIARKLTLDDLPRRDGLPELLFETIRGESKSSWQARSLHGALPAIREQGWAPIAATSAPETTTPLIELLLFSGRLNRDSHPELVVRLENNVVAIAEVLQGFVVVTSTSEVVDFVGNQEVDDLPGDDGEVTLREAILAANNTIGPNLIQFNIPWGGNDCHDGACWFTPSDGESGPLPPISSAGGAIYFDGYSQTESQGDTNSEGPDLVLDGVGLASGNGFNFQGIGGGVTDFAIVRFAAGAAILGSNADGLSIQSCHIGTGITGTTALPNQNGIALAGGSANGVLGAAGTHGDPPVPNGNLISGNSNSGILLSGPGTSNNAIRANRIGTNLAGSLPIANSYGILLGSDAEPNVVGGLPAGERNLISGNNVGVWVAGSDATLIQGNWIGTDAAGIAAIPNDRGIKLTEDLDGTNATTVGGVTAAARNVISGNTNHGIDVSDFGTTGTLIQGNWIGLNAAGTAALGNGIGVRVFNFAMPTTIGGAAAGAGNVISGNSEGVALFSNGHDLFGNRLGTDATGTLSVSNSSYSVHVGGAGNDIGGANAGEGNQIAGSGVGGVLVDGGAANRVRGNTIGLNAAGDGIVGNLDLGIVVEASATATEIGGASLAERNWIVGASLGLFIRSPGTVGTRVRGNVFGRTRAASGALFANTRAIVFSDGANGSTVGGSGLAANEITNSLEAGIQIMMDGSDGNRLTRNSIHDNDGLGIDLAGDGVSANDAGDGDSGPNNLVNWPVLASATNVCGTGATTVVGAVDSPTPSPELGSIEAFASSSADPSGNGEGATFVGQASPFADGTFSFAVPLQSVGTVVTATYTDDDDNTSEFSNPVVVGSSIAAPSGLSAERVGANVELDWSDNSSGELGFRIERRTAQGSFGLLANVGANVESFSDPGPFTAGTTYSYRVRAEIGACLSGWSNVASVAMPLFEDSFESGDTGAWDRTLP